MNKADKLIKRWGGKKNVLTWMIVSYVGFLITFYFTLSYLDLMGQIWLALFFTTYNILVYFCLEIKECDNK